MSHRLLLAGIYSMSPIPMMINFSFFKSVHILYHSVASTVALPYPGSTTVPVFNGRFMSK